MRNGRYLRLEGRQTSLGRKERARVSRKSTGEGMVNLWSLDVMGRVILSILVLMKEGTN